MEESQKQALSELKLFVGTDVETRERLNGLRKAWPEAQGRLLASLGEIVTASEESESFDRKLYVQSLSGVLKSVTLFFGNIPSGLVSEDDADFGVEYGARLVFGQSDCGRVFVLRYPFWSELPGENTISSSRQPEVLGSVDPTDLNRDYIFRAVTEFFRWAIDSTQAVKLTARIGFEGSPLGVLTT